MKQRELIIEDLPEKKTDTTCYIGFRRRLKDGTNIKEAWIGVHKVENPEHEEYGMYCIMSWYIGHNEYYSTMNGAIKIARAYLRRLKQEFLTGKRNWWTSKLVKQEK